MGADILDEKTITYNGIRLREARGGRQMERGKIFIRERLASGEGAQKPRLAVLGVAGLDLKIFTKHVRKVEIEQIALAIDADLIILEAGKDQGDEEE